MAGYVIADVDVQDPEAYAKYRDLVVPLVAKYGGKYLVRGGAYEQMEGDLIPKRIVVIEFESVEKAKEWYHSEDYRPVMAIRHQTAVSNVIIAEGA
jgi:uncharacterized protein (DUF1330 family)